MRLREFVLIALTMLAMTMVILGTINLPAGSPAVTLVPLVVAICAVAAVLLIRACLGCRWSMIFFLCTLAFVNDALFRVREPGELSLDWQNALKFLLWGSAGLIGICRLRSSLPRLQNSVYIWLSLYMIYALLSSIYSASALYSFSTAFGLSSMLLFAVALAAKLQERDILLGLALSLWVFVLAGWVVYFEVPELGRSLFITSDNTVVERICGLAGQANALGCVLAVLLMLTFLLWDRGHIGLWLVGILGGTGIFTLLIADSRTAILAFGAGVAAIYLRRSIWLAGSTALAVGGLSLFVLAIPVSQLMQISGGLSRSGDPTELLTFTGRTEIWSFAWDKILDSPWVGYGYNSSKFILPQFSGLPGLVIDEAHNMLLQNLLGVGIIGTIPLLCVFVTLIAAYIRRSEASRDGFTFLNLIWGITVAGSFGSTPTVMSLATFCGLALAGQPALTFGTNQKNTFTPRMVAGAS